MPEPLVAPAERRKSRPFYERYPLEFKKNREKKLQQTAHLCEVCGAVAEEVHHLDRSIDNHDLENLLAVCSECHWRLHDIDRGRPNKFKFRGKNYTVSEVAELSGVSFGVVNAFCLNPKHITIGSYIKIIKGLRKLEEEEMKYESLMTIDELADYLKHPKLDIRKKVATNSIPHLRFPTRRGGIRFRKEDIDKWLLKIEAREMDSHDGK